LPRLRHPRRPLSSPLRGLVVLVASAVPAAGGLLAAPLPGGGRVRGPATRIRASLRASVAEGMVTELISACAGATVLTGWALHLNSTPLEIGLLGALPFLAQLAQVPAAWLTALAGRRRVALVAVSASRQALLPLAILPFLPVSAATQRAVLLAVAAAIALLGVVGNNAWVAWMGELVPERIRGRYFGRRTALCTLAGTLAGLVSAQLLDRGARAGATGPVLALLALAGCAAGAATTWLMLRQHEPAAPPPARPCLSAVIRPLRDPAARGLLVYQLAWNAAVGLGGAYFAYHLLGNLKVGFTVVALHAAAGAVVRILSAPLWGRAIDRLGARPVLAACSFLVAVLPALWLFVTPSRLWPIAVDAVIGGAAWGGHGLAAFAVPLAVAPRRERCFYLAAFSMAGGVAWVLATVAGGAIVGRLPARFEAFGAPAYAVHVVFAVSALGRLGAATLALRIAERGAGSLGELHQLARGAVVGAVAEVRVRAEAGLRR
jgi:MFS family permease